VEVIVFKHNHSKNNINEQIITETVLLIEENGSMLGKVDLATALQKARDLNVDLVEISQQPDSVSVCKLVDYKKYCFTQRRKLGSKTHKAVKIKEIQLGLYAAEHDYTTKLKNARRLLDEGNKVKILIIYKGREVIYKDRSIELKNKIIDDLSDVALVEHSPHSTSGRKKCAASILLKSRGKHAKTQNP
jgi:translation initiation factor IF-3